MSWPLSVGDTAAIIAAFAAVIAAPAAIQGARFAAEALGFAKKEAERADEQRDYEVMPRPRVRWLGPRLASANLSVGGGTGGLWFYNVGGAAPNIVWVGTGAGNLYAAFATLPGSHTDYIEFGTDDLGRMPDGLEVNNRVIDTLVLIAQDIYGRWWNCLVDQRTTNEPRIYLLEQLQRLGLQDFVGRVYQVGRLDRDALEA